MPHLETWPKLPPAIRQHLIDRMRDRSISIADLDELRIWVVPHPLVPEGYALFQQKFLGSHMLNGVSRWFVLRVLAGLYRRIAGVRG